MTHEDGKRGMVPSGDRPLNAEMPFNEAREILAGLALFDHTSLHSIDHDQVGNYTAEQLRQAFRTISRHLNDNIRYPGNKWKASSKRQLSFRVVSIGGELMTAHLALMEDGRDLTRVIFPLNTPDYFHQLNPPFYDNDTTPSIKVTHITEGDNDIPNYRNAVLGLRWMAANMLTFENPNTYVTTEQLRHMQVTRALLLPAN